MYLSRTRAGRGSLLVLLFAIFASFASLTVHAALVNNNVSLTYMGEITGKAGSLSITKDGRILFLADSLRGLQIVDVSDSTAYDVIQTLETQGKPQFSALHPDESALFVADGRAGLSIYDVSNPRMITLRANLPLSGGSAEIVRVTETKAFVVQTGTGLTVVNVTASRLPQVMQRITFWNLFIQYFAFRLQVSADGTVFCVLAKSSQSSRRLFVYKVDAGDSLFVEKFAEDIEYAEDIALTKDGRHLFISASYRSNDASYSGGVHRLDLTNVMSPARTTNNLIKGEYLNDAAWHLHLNQDDSRLYLENYDFAVFQVSKLNRDLEYLTKKQLFTNGGANLYPAVTLETPDKLTLFCGAGFGLDVIALVSLTTASILKGSQQQLLTSLMTSTSRIGLMTTDGKFALFLQRDPSIDKGKLTVLEVATSSQFFFTLDFPWPAEQPNERTTATVSAEKLYVTKFTASLTLKYAIPFVAMLLQYSSRIKAVINFSPPPPSPPPPPPPAFYSNGAIRLVNGVNPYGGRVEYFYNGAWGTVCDDDFDSNEGRVICRQLGLEFDTSRNASVYSNAYYGQGSGSIYLDNLLCSGTESALKDCKVHIYTPVWNWVTWSYDYIPSTPVISANPNVIGQHNCLHYEDAAVQCSPPAVAASTQSGDIRLVGVTDFEGRVEIFYGSSWGTVCADAFDLIDASVVCKQVGMKHSNGFMKASYWKLASPPGTGPIYRDETRCVGTENRLIDCPANLIGVSDCSHSRDVYVSCVHDTLNVSRAYTFPSAIQAATDVFDERSQIWYAATQADGLVLKAIDFKPSPVITHSLSLSVNSASASSSSISALRLSADGKALFVIKSDNDGENSVVTVNATNVSSMSINDLGQLNAFEASSLATSTSGRLLVLVYKYLLYLVDASIGDSSFVLGTYISTCRPPPTPFSADNQMTVVVNGDDSRILLTHSHSSCLFSELVDSSDARHPVLLTIIDELTAFPKSVMHNESSYYIYESADGPENGVIKVDRATSYVQMFSGPTQVGSKFDRQFTFSNSGITNLNVSLAGSVDDVSATGLTFKTDGYSYGTLTGVVDKDFTNRVLHLVLTYDESGDVKHVDFEIHVKSTVRAYMFGSTLILSSAQPLLTAQVEIPSSTNATFVTTDALAVQQTFSEGNRVVQLFGVQIALNSALTQLRYHSLSPEAGVSAIALNVKVSDLLSPEMSLETLGVARFTLASLRYNAHPVVHGNASTVLRFTLGESFTYVFNRSTFSDADDQTLTYSLDQVHGEAFPAWLTFDKDNFKLVSTEDSKDGVTLNETTNRYELTKEMILSATDGYTKVSTRFTLALYNYRPQATRQTYATSMYVTKQQVIEFSNFFTDQDSNFGGSLRYRVREGDGKAAPFWVVINEDTGKLTLLPMAENFGTYDYVVTAYDGVNTETSITLNVVVDRTPMLKFFYYTTLMLTALGGLSTTYAMYKYFWIAKNMTRTRHNWGTRDPFIRNIDDLATHLVNYQIRVKTDKKNEIIDIHAVYALQMVQLAEPSWYLKCLSHNIRTWLSSKPLKDGRSVPQWLEIDKLKLTFGFVSSAFHAPSEAGMRYVLLVKEADGSTFDTLHIDLTLLKTADEEMGSQVVPPLKSPENNVAIRGQSQQTFLVTGQNLTPEQQASAVRIAQEALNNNRK